MGTFKCLWLLLLMHFLFLNRASKYFRLRNFTITLLSCPLLFLESGSLWQPSIYFGSISTPNSLQIPCTVSSRYSSGMLFGMPDISTLFRGLHCSPILLLFWLDHSGFSYFLPKFDPCLLQVFQSLHRVI